MEYDLLLVEERFQLSEQILDVEAVYVHCAYYLPFVVGVFIFLLLMLLSPCI